MLVYKCCVTGDELFSDAFCIKGPHTEGAGCDPNCHDVLISFQSKLTTEGAGGFDESLIGANKSAEGDCEDEGAEDAKGESKLDVVHAHRLKEVCFTKKKEVTTWLKDYMALPKFKKMQEHYSDAEKKKWQKNIMAAYGKITENFADCQFYQGERQEYESTMVFAVWNAHDTTGTTATCYCIRDSLIEEKQ